MLDIEHVLQWAYRDELPKRRDDRYEGSGGARVSPMFRLCALGGRVDNWNREPGFPASMGPPHPDALCIEHAVAGLVPADIDIAGYAYGFGRNPPGIDIDEIAARAAGQVAAIVATRARLGARPDHGPFDAVEPVTATNGKVTVFTEEERGIERNGECYTVRAAVPIPDSKRRGGFYPTGAFTKIRHVPGRVATFVERAEYAAWRAGLVILADRLEDTLASVRPTAPAAPLRPWDGEIDLNASGRTLTVAGAAAAGKVPVPTRGRPVRSQHGPVRQIFPPPAA